MWRHGSDRRLFHGDHGSGSGRLIKAERIPRVEGHMGLTIYEVSHGILRAVLDVDEPPRFLRKILVGRRFTEGHILVERICGICPTAHLMGYTLAVEAALGVKVSRKTTLLRELMVLMALVQSHGLQLHLTFPDLLGQEDIFAFAQAHPKEAERFTDLRDLAYNICKTIGGGPLPVTFLVGGMAPVKDPKAFTTTLRQHRADLQKAGDTMTDLVELLRTLRDRLSDFTSPREYMSLTDPEGKQYALYTGHLCSSMTGTVPANVMTFLDHTRLYEVPNSTTPWTRHYNNESFMVGPLARFNNNFAMLHPHAKEDAKRLGLIAPCFTPCYAVLARIVECRHALLRAVEILDELTQNGGVQNERLAVACIDNAEAVGVTEAPRGLVYYRLKIDGEGKIADGQLVIPTASNFARLQADLNEYVQTISHLSDKEIEEKASAFVRQAIDPCNSCAVNFAKKKDTGARRSI